MGRIDPNGGDKPEFGKIDALLLVHERSECVSVLGRYSRLRQRMAA
jgi:hypothetical protein